jgi:hypothetical protein
MPRDRQRERHLRACGHRELHDEGESIMTDRHAGYIVTTAEVEQAAAGILGLAAPSS